MACAVAKLALLTAFLPPAVAAAAANAAAADACTGKTDDSCYNRPVGPSMLQSHIAGAKMTSIKEEEEEAAAAGAPQVLQPPVRKHKFGLRRHLARGRSPHRWPRVARAPSLEGAVLAETREHCHPPESVTKQWSELSSWERRHVMDLGWKQDMWNCDGPECESPPSSETSWVDLPAKARDAARALGWTSTTWSIPGSEFESWHGLSEEEREGAKALGYTEESWDCSHDDCSQPLSDSLGWDELSEAERSGAETLGWTRTLWDAAEPRAAGCLSTTARTASDGHVHA
eukprot:CAMPEP_0204587390 /NCGR_PEP_ID=MMETSP0661-20131031/48026_1 /ASSEMBLY_ACC=CAM_ASM_000606 /TAXON_ID=109239 /ORGANISM="Alexandrium margalefi, Strain AMGDE01CS-322" /LENGTH=286 /DNA_ID=CAMNT_0051597105 /DNA_START=48 /DNA_END=905 /DNA_ORIENTATION=+